MSPQENMISHWERHADEYFADPEVGSAVEYFERAMGTVREAQDVWDSGATTSNRYMIVRKYAQSGNDRDIMVWDNITKDLIMYKEDPNGIVEPIRTMLKVEDGPSYMMRQRGAEPIVRWIEPP